MHIRHTLVLTAALSAPVALAQTQQAATLDDIAVAGATDLLGNFVKASLSVQPGAVLSTVNLRQVEQDALATGYLKSATATLQTVNGQNVLVLNVIPNPLIGSVTVSGVTFLPADAFKTSLANVLNIAPGATLNSARIDQSKQALAQNYKAEGYPFLPSISTSTKARADGSVDLTYTVDETAPVTRIEVSGSTLLPQDTVVGALKPLYDAKKFTPDAYFGALQQIQQAYQSAGYLASGVNSGASTLEGGVLKVSVLEGKISDVDLSNVTLPAGSAPVLLSKAGGVPSLKALEQDVRTLSNATGQSIGFALQPSDPQNPNVVRVAFGVAEATTGPVKDIQITGNTVVQTADLKAALQTRVGDVFSRIAAEADFTRLRDVYRKAGYEISTRDAIGYKDGVLTFNIHETRIAGYEINWTGPQTTKERVISRVLPEPGKLFNDKAFRNALDGLNAQGLIKINSVTTKVKDPAKPEDLTYVIGVSEVTGNRVLPFALQYDTLSGFSGSAGLQNNNLFGLGHQAEFNVVGALNDAGQNFTGNIKYTIPWLDIDFLDFRKVPTSVSANLYTNVTPNNALNDATGTDTGRQYSLRTTGFGLTAGRQLLPNLTVSASVGTNYNTYYLESMTDAEKAKVSTANQDDATAKTLLPATSLTTVFGVGSNYDSTSTPSFPTDGFRANASAAYGFGRSGDTPLSWTKLEAGASTYFGLGQTLQKGFNINQKQQAIAVRVNAGDYIGTPPPGTYFGIGYASANPAYELRGYDSNAFKGSSYVTGSAEYRYDLNVSNSFLQGVYLIGFADAGKVFGSTATNADGTAKDTFGYSVGAGIQTNISLLGVGVRLDYGFSPMTQSGQFHFRLGNLW
ncbi:BamA/OMP85 family outer membrane protein [Deinococcus aquiradiocola]|uniref:Outer membrane protein n=1 Tax=Deinococcus aquiradiocola TaxID=393059 RepID=A0A917PEH3_9DEIO|nr:POTRA domain-containing protein [Deinococcus aquiradiocola]GGJ73305.1 outer membrane protein [Deinococcus aquiradiocola]